MPITRKLNDTHLVILTTAAQHPHGRALPLSIGLEKKTAAPARALNQLLRSELIAEVPAQPDDQEWRRAGDDRRLTLAITEAGLSAIGFTGVEIASDGERVSHQPATDDHLSRKPPGDFPGDSPARKETSMQPFQVEEVGTAPPASNEHEAKSSGACAADAAGAKNVTFRPGTKAATFVKQLRRKRGASIAELMEVSGWQAHSVRGFLSGTLKKKHGLVVISENDESGHRRYRIGPEGLAR